MGATICWGLCCHRPPFLTLTGEKKGPGGAVSGGSMPSTCRAARHLGGSREGASCRGGGWRPPGFESGPHGRWAAAQGQVPAWPRGAGPGRAGHWSGVSASTAESGLAEGGAAQWRWGPDATIIPTRNLWGDRGPLTLDCSSLPVGGGCLGPQEWGCTAPASVCPSHRTERKREGPGCRPDHGARPAVGPGGHTVAPSPQFWSRVARALGRRVGFPKQLRGMGRVRGQRCWGRRGEWDPVGVSTGPPLGAQTSIQDQEGRSGRWLRGAEAVPPELPRPGAGGAAAAADGGPAGAA